MTTEKIDEDTSQQHVSTTYERVKKKIEHEDTLLNHRLGWMISTQGFFTIALGAFSAIGTSDPHLKHIFIACIAAIGVSTCLFSLIAARSSFSSIDGTMKWWASYLNHHHYEDKFVVPLNYTY